MSNACHDLVSVDMRGMKAALVAHARARRVGVSPVVRAAVARELQREDQVRDSAASPLSEKLIKVSIRLSSAEAEQLAAGAQEAGLSRGAYVAALIGGAVVTRLADHLTALTASCGELAILSRNLYHLTSLFRQGSARAAREYREMLDSLRSEVRRYLQVAADALADLRPWRTCCPKTPLIHESERKHD